MVRFHAQASFRRPGLHVWRPGTNLKIYRLPAGDCADAAGWWTFECALDSQIREEVRCLLYERKEGSDAPGEFESADFTRRLPRRPDGRFPGDVWLVQGAQRVLERSPDARLLERVRVHVITASQGQLYVWRPGAAGRRLEPAGREPDGLFFDLPLVGAERHFVQLKLVRTARGFEPDFANRVWSAWDGPEVWTHSGAPALLPRRPEKRTLRVHFRQELEARPLLRVWQESSDFQADVDGTPGPEAGWTTHAIPLFSGLPYNLKFWNPELAEAERWEHNEARREISLAGDTDVWTLEGDRRLFPARPAPDRRVRLHVAAAPPGSPLRAPIRAEVWVNRARGRLHPRVEAPAGTLDCTTYPDVVTSFRLASADGTERLPRHTLVAPAGAPLLERHVVPEREAVLVEPPAADLFRDPPFWIERPGAWEADGQLRFALHAPWLSAAHVIGEWTDWRARPLAMRSTRDGTYWWAQVPLAELVQALPAGAGGDYHGALYKLLLNGTREVQDPAAGWVESSAPEAASRLVRQARFAWSDHGWRIPSWEHWIVYQLHPKRLSGRFGALAPLPRVAREIEDAAGYLRGLGVSALLLMPVNEVGSRDSWGYDPAFYYAVERDYGGPDALKALVDTCHRHGLAVLVDVVFNHAGTQDNALWSTARDSFFDGDTAWGSMINFDHPQCRHFFEQNLVYLQREFHVDGFRLDHTHTIVHSHEAGSFVREPGSGGGWEFLHGLRRAVKGQAADCLLAAEHLPNEWAVTNLGGPMDSQWGDDFHDRLVDACRGDHVMPRLAEALRLSQSAADGWYKVTNYPESHDEVGNVNDRIAQVGGFGQGLRLSKVAAAATLLSRAIPMLFMGAESGEHRQFRFGEPTPLDLDEYLARADLGRVRAWWNALCALRKGNPNLQGPAPLEIRHADGQLLAWSRGQASEYWALLNFGGFSGRLGLDLLGLPGGLYRELWNSTWPAFAVEGEGEHTNGGRAARLHRGHALHVPDFGVVLLERV